VDPWLPDLDVAEAGLDLAPGQVAVADDLASPGRVLELGTVDFPTDGGRRINGL
jgi:hypothetical protein